jgi:predicted ATPase
VAEARAYPVEGELGYGAVVSWLRRPDMSDRLRRATAADRTVLARLLPELHPVDHAGPVGVAEAEQRQRVFDAAATVLTVPARPTLLVLDDAQWCDEQSLALVHYLLRREVGCLLLVVATTRTEDVDDDHPLVAVTAALVAIDRVVELPLSRLGPADTELLARHLGLGPDAAGEVFDETEGNPLFVVETVRAWREGAERGSRLTPRLQAVVAARLRRCSAIAREVLSVAATVGRSSPPTSWPPHPGSMTPRPPGPSTSCGGEGWCGSMAPTATTSATGGSATWPTKP